PIHANATHNAQDYHVLQNIKKRREQRHEKRQTTDACFNCGNIGHLSRDCPNDPKAGPRPAGGGASRDEF
ncbi:hypothetical protein EHS16_07790, partial [Streptococcus anginosus]